MMSFRLNRNSLGFVFTAMFIGALLLICSCVSDDDDDEDMGPEGGKWYDPLVDDFTECWDDTMFTLDYDKNALHDIDKLERGTLENTLAVNFIVAGDPHFNAQMIVDPTNIDWDDIDVDSLDWGDCKWYEPWDWDCDCLGSVFAQIVEMFYDPDEIFMLKDHSAHPLTNITDDINDRCAQDDPECAGVVMVGDMTRGVNYHYSQWYYRHIWEHDHPFSKSHGINWSNHTINYPVFPMVGNHDLAYHSKTAPVVHDYIVERVRDSEALFHPWGPQTTRSHNWYSDDESEIYIWEWGSFHFISLGLWAFYSGGDSGNTDINTDKVDWLRKNLKRIGKKKAIIMFQHYGWDGFSFDDQWWNLNDAKELINVICDRDDSDGGCDAPYNVIAIFSGHTHNFGHEYKYTDPDTNEEEYILCYEGIGECTRYLTNYIVDDAGHTCSSDGSSGYFKVSLEMTDDEFDVQGNAIGHLKIDKVKFTGCDPDDEFPNYDNIILTHNYDVPFTTEYLRFAQGQPDNANDGEHCAEIGWNGRYNDRSCTYENHVLCYDKENEGWWISDYTHQWEESYEVCNKQGYVFVEPQTVAEQFRVMNLMDQMGRHPLWVNYTDVRNHGSWTSLPELHTYFSYHQPDNGADLVDWSWGENCALLGKSDIGHYLMDDARCETEFHYFVCKKDDGHWYVESGEAGYWPQGFDRCEAEGNIFDMPDTADEFEQMLDDVAYYTDAHPDTKLWLNYNDIDREGLWVEGKPWFYDEGPWESGQPSGDGHCTRIGPQGLYVAECQANERESYHSACRNKESGKWNTNIGYSDWHEGFISCGNFEWNFDYPYRKRDFETLKAIAVEHGIDIWVNLVNLREQDWWRFEYYLKWASDHPQHNGDCAAFDKESSGFVDRPCDNEHPVLCLDDENNWRVDSGNPKTWFEAQEFCESAGYGDFSRPYNVAELSAIKNKLEDYSHRFTWIRLTDQNREGFWEDSLY